MRVVRAPFLARPSERFFAPSAPNLLLTKLRTRPGTECQWLLTLFVSVTQAGQKVRITGKCSGLPERLEAGIGLQRLGEVSGARVSQPVVVEAAGEGGDGAVSGC